MLRFVILYSIAALSLGYEEAPVDYESGFQPIEYGHPEQQEYEGQQASEEYSIHQGSQDLVKEGDEYEQQYHSSPNSERDGRFHYNHGESAKDIHDESSENFVKSDGEYDQKYVDIPKSSAQQSDDSQHHDHEKDKETSNLKDAHAKIKSSESLTKSNGEYMFSFASSNGITQHESGMPGLVKGSSKHTTPEGDLITLKYVADENGFHAEGSHIPTSPPLPQHIVDSLAWNAAHPEEEEEEDHKHEKDYKHEKEADANHGDNRY